MVSEDSIDVDCALAVLTRYNVWFRCEICVVNVDQHSGVVRLMLRSVLVNPRLQVLLQTNLVRAWNADSLGLLCPSSSCNLNLRALHLESEQRSRL